METKTFIKAERKRSKVLTVRFALSRKLSPCFTFFKGTF